MNLAETLVRAEPRQYGLWPSVARLLSLRVRIIWNTFRHSKLRNKIGTGVLLLLLVGFMIGLFVGSTLLLRFLRSPELAEYVDPTVMLNAIPTLVLTAAFFMTLMTNFGVLLQALYLSHDMDFLVTAPLPMRAVFLSKLVEAVLPNFALFCAVTLPVLFGLGASSGYNFLYYPLLVIMLMLLALAASGLASILVMAVVRVVPARRVAEVLGVVVAIISVSCGQIGNLMNAVDVDRADVGNALNAMTGVNAAWSPLAWAGRGLIAIGEGQWLAGAGLSLLALALAGAIFAGTLFLAEQLYYTGWASMQGVSGRKKRPARAAAAGSGARATAPNGAAGPALAMGSLLSAAPAAPARQSGGWWARLFPAQMRTQLRALIQKDAVLLRRDTRMISNFITPFILGFVMLFTTGNNARNPEMQNDLAELGVANLEAYMLIGLAVLVSWMLVISLSTLAFSREGKNYWILKTAPVGPWSLLISKFLVSYLPALIFGLVYLLIAYLIRGLNLTLWPFAALVVAMAVAGATGIGLGFGAAGANLEWDSPQRMKLSGGSGCLSFILLSAFIGLDMLLFLGPVILWPFLIGGTPWYAYAIGILLGCALALAAVIVPLVMVAPRLARIGEPG
jgi:ABC-2 type transport system permease protein